MSSTIDPQVAVTDLVRVLQHSERYVLGGDRYLSVVAFVTGVVWTTPSVLRGFQEFVGVHASTRSASWPSAVLVDEFDRREIAELLQGLGTPDANALAIDALVQALDQFGHAVDAGQREVFIERYQHE